MQNRATFMITSSGSVLLADVCMASFLRDRQKARGCVQARAFLRACCISTLSCACTGTRPSENGCAPTPAMAGPLGASGLFYVILLQQFRCAASGRLSRHRLPRHRLPRHRQVYAAMPATQVVRFDDAAHPELQVPLQDCQTSAPTCSPPLFLPTNPTAQDAVVLELDVVSSWLTDEMVAEFRVRHRAHHSPSPCSLRH